MPTSTRTACSSSPYVSVSRLRKGREGTRTVSLLLSAPSCLVGTNQVAKLCGLTRRSMCCSIFSQEFIIFGHPIPAAKLFPQKWKSCGNGGFSPAHTYNGHFSMRSLCPDARFRSPLIRRRWSQAPRSARARRDSAQRGKNRQAKIRRRPEYGCTAHPQDFHRAQSRGFRIAGSGCRLVFDPIGSVLDGLGVARSRVELKQDRIHANVALGNFKPRR